MEAAPAEEEAAAEGATATGTELTDMHKEKLKITAGGDGAIGSDDNW